MNYEVCGSKKIVLISVHLKSIKHHHDMKPSLAIKEISGMYTLEIVHGF